MRQITSIEQLMEFAENERFSEKNRDFFERVADELVEAKRQLVSARFLLCQTVEEQFALHEGIAELVGQGPTFAEHYIS